MTDSHQHAEWLSNRLRIRVNWGDCDAAGIVFYPRFFAWFDECTAALFETAGFTIRELQERFQVLGIPLADAHARFIVPFSYGDDIQAESTIKRWGNKSFVVLHRFFKGAELAVEGEEVRIWAIRHPQDPSRLRTLPIPAELIQHFRRIR